MGTRSVEKRKRLRALDGGAEAGLAKPRIPPSRAEGWQLNLRDLGERVKSLRSQKGYSLDNLAQRSGVSRSMISAIERGRKAGTVLILDRIATALGTSLARLFSREETSRIVLLRRSEQRIARDASGWERRILSPVLREVEFEFMRTTLGPGVDAGVFHPHAKGSREYVAIERGTLLLTIDGCPYELRAGDSIYYDGDCAHAFANPGRTPCVYYLTMDVTGDVNGTTHRVVRRRAGGGSKP